MVKAHDPVHPGEILLEEFLKPLGISQYKLAQTIGVPETRISEIVRGERAITTDTGLRLSKALGLSPRYWLNMQAHYDIEVELDRAAAEINSIPQLVAA